MRTTSRHIARAKLALACVVAISNYPLATPANAQQGGAINPAQAQALVKPLYTALTASDPAMVGQLLEQVTSADWQNCASNEQCEGRPAVIARWIERITVVPGRQWEQKALFVSGNHITVRGEDQGTPVAPFFGVQPSGNSFRIMTLDIHEVHDGKIVRTFHTEDWARATRQLSGSVQ